MRDNSAAAPVAYANERRVINEPPTLRNHEESEKEASRSFIRRIATPQPINEVL